MRHLKTLTVATVILLGTAHLSTAQTDPRKEYMECVLQCEAQYEGCFASDITSLSDSRHLLDRKRFALLQAKELTAVYNCLRRQGDCYSLCRAPSGRDKS